MDQQQMPPEEQTGENQLDPEQLTDGNAASDFSASNEGPKEEPGGDLDARIDARLGATFQQMLPMLTEALEKNKQETREIVAQDVRGILNEMDLKSVVAQEVKGYIDPLLKQYLGGTAPSPAPTMGANGNGHHDSENGPAPEYQQQPGDTARANRLAEFTQVAPFLAQIAQALGLGPTTAPAAASNPMAGLGQIKEWAEAFYGLQATMAQPFLAAEESAFQRYRQHLELAARAGVDPLSAAPPSRPGPSPEPSPAPNSPPVGPNNAS